MHYYDPNQVVTESNEETIVFWLLLKRLVVVSLLLLFVVVVVVDSVGTVEVAIVVVSGKCAISNSSVELLHVGGNRSHQRSKRIDHSSA